jgi:uncharacterized membrane protein
MLQADHKLAGEQFRHKTFLNFKNVFFRFFFGIFFEGIFLGNFFSVSKQRVNIFFWGGDFSVSRQQVNFIRQRIKTRVKMTKCQISKPVVKFSFL